MGWSFQVSRKATQLFIDSRCNRRFAASRCVQERMVRVCSSHESTMCSFQVCPGWSRRCATSRCVQEGGSTVRRFPVCPGRRSGVYSASWCVQEGESATCSFPVCPGRIVDSKQRPGVSREEIMRETSLLQSDNYDRYRRR